LVPTNALVLSGLANWIVRRASGLVLVGNPEVRPSVGVVRIQWNFEPMSKHVENFFEL
jgi:hypothetical protein